MKFLRAIWKAIKGIAVQKEKEGTDVQVKPLPPVAETPTNEDVSNFPKKKVAIIIGHGSGDGGADTWNGSNEFAYNSKVAEYAKENSKQLIKTFYRSSSGIVGVAMEAVLWRPDISIELHLNSFNGQAKGCEVLILEGDNKSAEIGRKFAKDFCNKFGRVARGDQGIKWLGPKERGAASLRALSPIKQSILVEPWFADNKNEDISIKDYSVFLTDFIDKL